MLTLLIALSLTAAPKTQNEKSPPEGSFRKIQLTDDVRTITVRVAANAVTSVRFNRQLDAARLACGDKQSFLFNVVGDNQLDIKGGTEDTRASTNCNLQTAGGHPVLLRISLTTRDKADAFIDVELTGKDAAVVPESGGFTPMQEEIIKNRVESAVAKAEAKAADQLVTLAASGIVARSMAKHARADDVILHVHDIVKLGSRGIIRFSIENGSRYAWAAGDVKLTVISGAESIAQEVRTFYKQQSVRPGEEIYGAITFEMYQVSESASFVVQTSERNGSRHPKVEGIRL